jgi:hypothetical protein
MKQTSGNHFVCHGCLIGENSLLCTGLTLAVPYWYPAKMAACRLVALSNIVGRTYANCSFVFEQRPAVVGVLNA